MKRRNFIRNVSLASVTAPLILNDIKFQGIAKRLFDVPKSAEDRVLVIVRLNGGNDGLNTVIPIDQYDNLVIQRPNIIIDETAILPLTADVGLHPVMTGMQDLFNSGKLGIIQNVGYPEQNRSHFRSMDIWSTGMLNPNETRGWLGRHFDTTYPNYPDDYPNATYPDPFAISMGYEVSSTCQGLMANFSHAVNDPFAAVNLIASSQINDGTYYGDHMAYLSTLIEQTNEFGDQINAAANAGSSLSTLYDPNNPIAVQLRYVAQMISGGLKSKVYILNINGFDTHDGQVNSTNHATGTHADLLKMLSDSVQAFQDDLQLLNLEHRVAGMTFSEFGRQIASNASDGTDHGDAAPLFLFGGCVNAGINGQNPTISNQIVNQAGIPMQIDFRDIYASILKDWFQVGTTEIQALFEHTVTYYPVLGSCNVGIKENEDLTSMLLYPNPATTSTTLRLPMDTAERVSIVIYDINGRKVQEVYEGELTPGVHHLYIDVADLKYGQYMVHVRRKTKTEKIQFIRVQ